MNFLFIIALILLLYARQYKYQLLMDDQIPRAGYLRVLASTEAFNTTLYDKQRPYMYTITNIGVYIATCLGIYYLFGFKVALLYAVFPLQTSSVMWSVGNMYQTTVMFIIVSMVFVDTPFWLLSPIFYFCALHSTVSAIPYAFYIGIMALTPLGGLVDPLHSTILHFLTLALFLVGKRFTGGLKDRKELNEKLGYEAGKLAFKNLLHVPKTLAYYVYLSIFPMRLGFFHYLSQMPEFYTKRWLGISTGIVFVFFGLGYAINPLAILGWFLFAGVFSQYILLGQFVTERYTYIANIFFCIILTQFLEPYPTLFAVIATLYFCKSWEYGFSFERNDKMFAYSLKSFPKNAENYGNYACYLLNRSRFLEAINPLKLGLMKTEGNKWILHGNLASCYQQLNRFKEALFHNEKALETCELDKKAPLIEQKSKINESLRKLNRQT